MRLAFIWQGISGRYGHWQDGLWKAMQIIGTQHEVKYFEPTDDIESFNPDWVLYWEAPCTINGKDKENYLRVCNLPFKKALLFAGGPIESMWVKDFDHVFIESQIDMDTCERLNIPHSKAFGINTDLFYPECPTTKIYDGIHHGTCASWKRQWLVGESLHDKGLVVGRFQETDPMPFARCRKASCTVMSEKTAEELRGLINQSHCLLQTSNVQGGGQRATLEAIACGIPVVCMSDSPKNREFVEESGYGMTCDPNVFSIVQCIEACKKIDWDIQKSQEYIKKWSGEVYADNILKTICN